MFKIQAEPTFLAKVEIPVAGGPSAPVAFNFKHRSAKELDEWKKTTEGRPEADIFMECVVGWVETDAEAKKVDKSCQGLSEAFTRENVELLLDQRAGTAMATYITYITELTKHKEKN